MAAYQALFEPADEGGFVITFPDFGYGVTQGETEEECAKMAADLLACLIADRIQKSSELPAERKHRGKNYRTIQLPALQSAMAELYRAFQSSGIRKAELARRLGE